MKCEIQVTGLNEAISNTKAFSDAMSFILGSGLRAVTKLGATKARYNAPIDTGNLRSKLQALPVIVSRVQGEGGVGTTGVPYALKMHEAAYKLGPISATQPMTPEGGVGNKYVARVVYKHALTTFLTMMKATSDKVLEALRAR